MPLFLFHGLFEPNGVLCCSTPSGHWEIMSSVVSSCPDGRNQLTDLAAWPHPPGQTVAGEAIGLVDTGAAVVTGGAVALVDVHFAPVA